MPPLIRFTRPPYLLLAILAYAFGLGFANYLGTPSRPDAQFLGGAVVLLVLAASGMFGASFRPLHEPLIPEETRSEREKLRQLTLAFGVGFLGAAGMLFLLMQRIGLIQRDTALLFSAFAVLALANALPPVRLSNRGFGEIVDAFLIASLTPTLAFFLQTGSFHRLLSVLTFPLFMVALACFLALNFPDYANDLKYQRRSLLVALTWQQAVPIHNLLLAAAYLVLAAGPLFGVSFGQLWPVLLTLPLAAWQAWMLNGIANGATPIWRLLKISAFAIVGLAIYLLALAFWLG